VNSEERAVCPSSEKRGEGGIPRSSRELWNAARRKTAGGEGESGGGGRAGVKTNPRINRSGKKGERENFHNNRGKKLRPHWREREKRRGEEKS